MIKAGFIGCGNMGGTLATAASKTNNEIYLSDLSDKLESFAKAIGGRVSDNIEIAKECDVIFLGVKPQVLEGVLTTFKNELKERKTPFVLVSMAAGVEIAKIKAMLGFGCPIIRIMPNTPAQVEEGMILYCANELAEEKDIEKFLDLMKFAGKCDLIGENVIDAASAVSGCGPAFVYMFIEALADGGVKCGLTREKAIKYAAQTLLGASKMVLETGKHPGELKDAVCSPAGSTIEGVRTLENSAFRSACIEAVSASFKRTKELGK